MLDENFNPLYPWDEKTKLIKRKNIICEKIALLKTPELDALNDLLYKSVFGSDYSDGTTSTEGNVPPNFREILKAKPWLNLQCVILMDERDQLLSELRNGDCPQLSAELQKCRSALLKELKLLRLIGMETNVYNDLFVGLKDDSADARIIERRMEAKVKFRCSLCGRQFFNWISLNHHLTSAHEGSISQNNENNQAPSTDYVFRIPSPILHQNVTSEEPPCIMNPSFVDRRVDVQPVEHLKNVFSPTRRLSPSPPFRRLSEAYRISKHHDDSRPSMVSHYSERSNLNQRTQYHFLKKSGDLSSREVFRRSSRRDSPSPRQISRSPQTKHSRRDLSPYGIRENNIRMSSSSIDRRRRSSNRPEYNTSNSHKGSRMDYEITRNSDHDFRSKNTPSLSSGYADKRSFNGLKVAEEKSRNSHAEYHNYEHSRIRLHYL